MMETALSPERARLLQLLRSKGRHIGNDILAQTLHGLGITHIFGTGGAPVDATLAACARAGMRVIATRHQQAAVLMSLAHNYVSGALRSAVIVPPGPCVTNCVTGVLVGHDNCWPLLVVSGRLAHSRRGSFQSLDGSRLMASITKFAAPIDRTDSLASSVSQAVITATAGTPGPVYLDIADEALTGSAEFCAPGTSAPTVTHPATLDAPVDMPQPANLRDAVSLLSAARRPAMLIGKGARWSAASAFLRRLADDYSIPFATSPMGRGLLPDDHPLCFSAIRGRMLADADVVLMVGARFNWTFRFGNEISSSAQIVRIDVDPVEAAEVLGRGVGLQGDASCVLQHVLGTLDANTTTHPIARDTDWLNELKTLRATFAPGVVPAAELGLQPMSPYEWLGELSTVMPENAITVLDGNVVMTSAQRILSVRHPATRLGPGTTGCMGIGVPFAIGAKLARPDLPVIAIVGDFAFGLSALEVETALRYQVPVVLIVANNGGPGGATRQRKVFPADHPERVLQFVPGIRHDLMMASFGGLGLRVDGPGQIGTALNDALASNGPVCIDVVTNEDTAVSAAI